MQCVIFLHQFLHPILIIFLSPNKAANTKHAVPLVAPWWLSDHLNL